MKSNYSENGQTSARRFGAVVALALLGGCKGSGEIGLSEGFLPEDETRSVRRFTAAQAASGARADGMLYAAHFDGEHLNSLGQDKLDLMLRANDRDFPVVVYLNVPADDRLKARQAAALVYFKDRGLADAQVKFEVGPNPYASSPAAANLARLSKTEDASGVGGTGPVSPQNASAPAPAEGGAGLFK